MTSSDRFARAQELFHHALSLPRGERDAFLAGAAGEDRELAREVRELLELDADLPVDDAPHASSSGRNYRLVRQIGEGYSAWVYEAVQLSIGRRVAFKVLKSHAEISRHAPDASYDSVARRFDLEARVLGSLDHPGIVPIYDVGEDERGRRGFAMRLVEGDTFAEVIARTPPGAPSNDLARAVAILAGCCETLAFAHARGVVHRDLKPAHLIGGLHGEAYVIDWGLATNVGAAQTARAARSDASEARAALDAFDPGARDGLTTVGTALGTPGYMPPEQARGERERIGPASDVYALGAILHHLLAGRRPYADERGDLDPERFLAEVAERAPTLDAPAAPVDLRAICETAMQRDPARRYAHAGLLAADLRASLEGRPIRARPGGVLDRAVRFSRRRPAIVGLVVVALLAAASFAAFWRNAPFARADRDEAALEAAYGTFAYSDFDAARAQFAALESVPEARSGEILCAILAGDHASARTELARSAQSGDDVPGARWLRAFLDLESGLAVGEPSSAAAERDAFAAFLRGWTTLRRVRTDDLAADGSFVLPLAEREVGSPRVELLEDALRDFTNAVDFATAPRALFHFGRIRAALLLGRTDEARRSSEALLHRWPRSAMARTWAGLAELYDDPARGTETLRGAEGLVVEDASAASTRLTLAYVLQSFGARADAERLYRIALRGAAPAIAARAHSNLALLALEDGRAEVALADAELAVALDPSAKPAWLHRANALHALGRGALELDVWRECAARFPDDAMIRTTLCAVLLERCREALERGELDVGRELCSEALEDVRRAGDALPDDLVGDAYLEAARCDFERGEHAAGLALLDEWHAQRPEDPRALAELAWRLVCALVDPSASDCPPAGDAARALEISTRLLAFPGERGFAEVDTHACALHANGRSAEALVFARQAEALARAERDAAFDDVAQREALDAALVEIERHVRLFEDALAPR